MPMFSKQRSLHFHARNRAGSWLDGLLRGALCNHIDYFLISKYEYE